MFVYFTCLGLLAIQHHITYSTTLPVTTSLTPPTNYDTSVHNTGNTHHQARTGIPDYSPTSQQTVSDVLPWSLRKQSVNRSRRRTRRKRLREALGDVERVWNMLYSQDRDRAGHTRKDRYGRTVGRLFRELASRARSRGSTASQLWQEQDSAESPRSVRKLCDG